MRAPILPYYGGEFMGIKPPKPVSIVISNNGGASGTVNCIKFPAPDTGFDGSYFWAKSGTSLERYNGTNTLIWTLTVSAVASGILTGTTAILGLGYASDNICYLLAYNSTTKGCKLFKLSSPATTAGVTAVGGGFTVTNTLDTRPEQCTIFEKSDGNLQLRANGVSLIINKTTGALVAESQISQSGRTLSMYQAAGLLYQSADQTIEVTGFSYGYTPDHINVFRNGKFATIPATWVKVWRTAPITIRLWGDYVMIAQADDYQVIGCTGLDRTDFDRWLIDVCDAMGI